MTWTLLLKGGGLYFVLADYLLIGLLGWMSLDLVFRRLRTPRVDSIHRILDMGIALCPFMGLAGTVWEISGVLLEMGGGVTGTALAAPLGAALRYTFHGIVAASLCLVGSSLTGALMRRNSGVTEQS